MPIYHVDVNVRGPLFAGLADQVIEQWARAVEEELANQGQEDIRRRTRLMRRTNSSRAKIAAHGYRPHTGAAARHVSIAGRPDSWVIKGSSEEGVTWWPWLEGTSKRNLSTRFKGYHTFRIVKNVLQRKGRRVGQEMLSRYLPALGGD